MSPTRERRLDRECEVFVRYLTGRAPDGLVREGYRAAHRAGVVELPRACTSFDRVLVRLACLGPVATRAADSHARVFRPGGLLRRKLVLVLALLESGPAQREVDTVQPGSRLGLFARMAWMGACFALVVLVTGLVLLPVRLACLALPGART